MKKKLLNNADLYLRLLYLVMFIVSFAFYESLSFLYKICTVLIVFDLAYWFVIRYRDKNKSCYDSKLIFLVMILMTTHFISAVVNYKENFIGNIVEIVFMFSYCYIGILYNKSNIEKLFEIYVYIIEIYSFVLMIATYIILFMQTTIRIKVTDLKVYKLGIYNERIYSLINPNTMAGFAYISVMLAIIMIVANPHRKKRNFLLKMNAVFQLLFLGIQQSRGAFLSCLFMILLYNLYIDTTYKNIIKKLLKAILMGSIFMLIVILTNEITNDFVASYLPVKKIMVIDTDGSIEKIYINQDNMEDEYIKEEIGDNKIKIRFDNKTSNGRSFIWKKAFEMIQKKPVFGYGVRNIKDHYPEGLNNSIIHNQNFHNVYINAIVSGGIINLIAFIFLIIYISLKFYNYLRKGNSKVTKFVIILYFGLLINEFFESTILYVTSFFNLFFWFIVGFAVYLIERKFDYKIQKNNRE